MAMQEWGHLGFLNSSLGRRRRVLLAGTPLGADSAELADVSRPPGRGVWGRWGRSPGHGM